MPNQYSPSHKDKLIAKMQGDKTYNGVPCRNCGSTIKSVTYSGCVKCHIERSKRNLYDGTINKYHTPEKSKNRLSRWRKNNPEKVAMQRKRVEVYQAAYQSGRRSKIKNQTPSGANNIIILSIYEEARKLTQLTGIPYEVDHKIPIVHGGLHHQDNLQIITQRENRQKGSRL